MNRATFLRRSLAVVGALALGRVPETPAAAPLRVVDGGALELGIVRDSLLNATNDFQVFGEQFVSGGLCAPLARMYPVSAVASPVRDALPTFCAVRGEIAIVGDA